MLHRSRSARTRRVFSAIVAEFILIHRSGFCKAFAECTPEVLFICPNSTSNIGAMSRKSVIPSLDELQCPAAPGRDPRGDERRDLHPSNAATGGIVKATVVGDSAPRPATRPPRTIDIGCATGSISRCPIRQEPTRRYQRQVKAGRARKESVFGSRERMAEQAVSGEPFSPRSCLFSGKIGDLLESVHIRPGSLENTSHSSLSPKDVRSTISTCSSDAGSGLRERGPGRQ